MPSRALLLGLVLVCMGGAGCTEAEVPEAVQPGPLPPFEYSLYLDREKPQPGADVALIQRPEHLERVYARRYEDGEAKFLFGWLELQFRETGARFADMTALVCALDLPIRCIPDWEFIDSFLGHSDGPGARHLRQALADAFSARARQRGVENTVVLSIAQAVLTRGMLKGAIGKASAAAEARAAAGSAQRAGTRGATPEARLPPPAGPGAAAVGAERLVTGRLRAPRELSAIQARLAEAEALETGARQTPVLKDLARLRPLPERPPSGVDAGEALWRDYVTYWERRFTELSMPEARTAGLRPPLTWEGYRPFRTRFARAMRFQSDVSALLQEQVEKPQGQRQFLHDMARPQQRDFTRLDNKAVIAQVEADAREALRKYGGTVEVRRSGHPLFERKVTVTQVHVVYDESLAPHTPELRTRMETIASGLGVTLHFHHVP